MKIRASAYLPHHQLVLTKRGYEYLDLHTGSDVANCLWYIEVWGVVIESSKYKNANLMWSSFKEQIAQRPLVAQPTFGLQMLITVQAMGLVKWQEYKETLRRAPPNGRNHKYPPVQPQVVKFKKPPPPFVVLNLRYSDTYRWLYILEGIPELTYLHHLLETAVKDYERQCR